MEHKGEDDKKGGIQHLQQEVLGEMAIKAKLVNHRFRSLDSDVSNSLQSLFSLEEVKSVVWACGNEKASGPYGFSSKFIKK